jgi:UvrB/uvrC motif
MSMSSIERRIAELAREMATAAAADDFERAAALRDEIAALKGEAKLSDAPLVRQPPPGQMGLGTHVPVAAPPKGWRPPRKPDPLTRNTRPGGRRR